MEQTTSSAWPNVLATQYMKQTGSLAADVELKAKEYIALGYQKLVTFECASGGFNWWEGDDPGNAILSGLAVMMFTDTAQVSFVDTAVIERTAQYLADAQQSDGSWTEETHLHAGNENLGAGSVRATAYIAWALAYADLQPQAVSKAIGHIKSKLGSETDLYTLAMAANALAWADPTGGALQDVLSTLHDAAVVEGDFISWNPGEATMVGGGGNAAKVEITSLVALAMMQAHAYGADVQGAINFIVDSKDPQGNWGYSTQATVLALKALIASLSSGAPETDAVVTVSLNGKEIATRTFDNFNADVMWQVELAPDTIEGDNALTVEYVGNGNLMYQIVGEYYLPWDTVETTQTGSLGIDVAYDKTELAVDDTIHVTVTVANSDPAATGMVMAELGLPPGFQVDTSALEELKLAGVVSKIEKTAMQLLVYIDSVPASEPVVFTYDLIAQYPLQASAPKSETYFYYDKEQTSESAPVEVTVQ